MKRNLALVGFCLLMSAQPAISGSFQSQFAIAASQAHLAVIQMLKENGYSVVSIKRTFLGRAKVTVTNNLHTREIIVSRSTGEVMHERTVSGPSKDAKSSPGEGTGNGGSSNGNSGGNGNGNSGGNGNGNSGNNGNGKK
jgi:uncharacterized membrane protein YgcG